MATDEQLLAAYLKGDESALSELVSRYQQELFSFLQRFVNDAAVADDLFQETFVQVFRHAASFDLKRKFRPWLFTIAANRARDYLRLTMRQPTVSLDGGGSSDGEGGTLADRLKSDEPTPLDNAQLGEDARRVREVIDRLSPIYREVLLLSYFNRFAYQEIAEMLHLPIGTVKSRLHGALVAFERLWGQRLEHSEK
ncbi:MAG: sigma-70 family RNA polymerase sigma factor [Phycisphaerales bacterium]|nr:sigma-70 family RNA polymerase sigma factor [Phycisphaerales bacterium]